MDKSFWSDTAVETLLDNYHPQWRNHPPAMLGQIVQEARRALDVAIAANRKAITVWKDGWKIWQYGDAHYAENDPDWIMTIRIPELGERESPPPAEHKS